MEMFWRVSYWLKILMGKIKFVAKLLVGHPVETNDCCDKPEPRIHE